MQDRLKLRRQLPPNRTLSQVWNHYQIEKAIADRLKKASRAERGTIYRSMYDELFQKVPDHPRLTRKDDAIRTAYTNQSKLRLVQNFLNPSVRVAEFAPGDCHFLRSIANRVKFIYGIDISDQHGDGDTGDGDTATNWRLIIYDGFDTNEITDGSLDLVVSDQLIEHLHVQDTPGHFVLVARLLKNGGTYVFRTPHAFTGPHDVSAYFCD